MFNNLSKKVKCEIATLFGTQQAATDVPPHLSAPAWEDEGFVVIGETALERSTVTGHSFCSTNSQWYLDQPPSYASVASLPSSSVESSHPLVRRCALTESSSLGGACTMGANQTKNGLGEGSSAESSRRESPEETPDQTFTFVQNGARGAGPADDNDVDLICLDSPPSSLITPPPKIHTACTDVPFVLSPLLIGQAERDRLVSFSGISNIASLHSGSYSYDFSLERTTLRDTS